MSGKETKVDKINKWILEYIETCDKEINTYFLARYLAEEISKSDCIWNKRSK